MQAISNAGSPIGAVASRVVDIRPYRLRGIIRQREARARHFPGALFADPAWDLLLDLALAHLAGTTPELRARRSMSPPTVQRWLGLLADEGLATGAGDDWRLSEHGLRAVSAWLSERRAKV